MEKLPREIASNIFSRLPFDSVMHCTSVSKSWYNLLQHLIYTSGERYFAQKHHSSSLPPDSVPLMFDQSDHDHDHDDTELAGIHYAEYNDDENGMFNCKAVKKLNCPLDIMMNHHPNKCWTMATSSNGLICSLIHQTTSTADDDNSSYSYLFYIYNPFLGEYVTLPKLKYNYSSISSMVYGFSHIPSTDEYKVVAIVYTLGGGDVGNIEVYTLGGNGINNNRQWTSKGNIKYRLLCDSPGVVVNGSLHWLTVVVDEDKKNKDEEKWYRGEPLFFMEIEKQQKILTFNLLQDKFDHRIESPPTFLINLKLKDWGGFVCGLDYAHGNRTHETYKFTVSRYQYNLEQQQQEPIFLNGEWEKTFCARWDWPQIYEHCFFWRKADETLLWTSNSSVVSVKLDDYFKTVNTT